MNHKSGGTKKMDKNQGLGKLIQVGEETDDLLERLDEVGKPKEKTKNKTSISHEMWQNLYIIEQLILEGYTLDKTLKAFPVLTRPSGINFNLSLIRNPAGFSWIGFFFPFAVCTQIREWSYFYVTGISYIMGSIISSLIKADISGLISISISLAYGVYLPYLRYMAAQHEIVEIPKGKSIIYGLLISLCVAIPSMILDSILGVG
ncbi:hypothetical protein KBY58_00285 [Cyanobium sp. HWJ4-Hawea]|uniref:hypothetical protein n=1 Tax=Cyanobium sp. HWJ4-Hawea TaxID=2823713 RepID=UPI0020CB86CE|nr:hypothetical protein [Cyanobium sp. HWJ4-Hawea]MCP9807873.1 hypothetical protein [Cyanobium sp. HWJ4-Hawea]